MRHLPLQGLWACAIILIFDANLLNKGLARFQYGIRPPNISNS